MCIIKNINKLKKKSIAFIISVNPITPIDYHSDKRLISEVLNLCYKICYNLCVSCFQKR